MGLAIAVLVLAGGGATAYVVVAKPFQNSRTDLILHRVKYGRLELTIVERGALESANNHEIVCRVKAKSQQSQNSTTIKSLVDEGTHVKKGDLLIDLDDSGLIEQLKDQKIVVDKAQSDWVQAEQQYKIAEEKYKSDRKTAETDVELAKIDLEKYLKGDYPQNLQDVDGRIKVAESDLEQQRDRAAWAQRMLKKGYYSVSQADSEQSKLQSLELALAKVVTEKRVLVDPAYGLKKRSETDYANKVAVKALALSQVEKQWIATEVQDRTDRDTKKSIYEQGVAKYKEIDDEIKKCKLYAPIDGLVVYFIPENTRWGVGRQAVVAQGESVAENQKLMQIPDLKHMFVNVKVHEAMVRRVHKGQPAMIRVESMSNRRLRGHVEAVANAPSQQDFWAADVKVYTTKVTIDEEVDGLKPGMTAEVTITVADALDHVLLLPIQAIAGSVEMGDTRKCFVMRNGMPVERDITVGMSNDKDAEILSGLQEGDEVVVNPKVLVGDRMRTRQPGELISKDTGSDAAGPGSRGGRRGGERGAGRGQGQPGGPQGFGGEGGQERAGPETGKAGGQRGAFQPTEAQKKAFQEKLSNYQKATPEKRKEMLGKENERARPFIKQALQGQGVEVPE
jgi:multidrug efflux pump subunit AcrA (membrane-fusion protein)